MTPDLSSAGIYTDLNALTRLRGQARQNSPEAARTVAKQFEALFVQMMLKNMREADAVGGLFESDQTKLYRDLFDKQISMDVAARGQLGLADMLVKQIAPPADSPGGGMKTGFNPRPFNGTARDPFRSLWRRLPGAMPAVDGTNTDPAVPADGAAGGADPATFASPAQFVRELTPYAEDAGRRLGLSPDLLLAQAALETGWGQHMIRHRDGSNTYNLFGIKADPDWPGASVHVSTLEFEDGIANRRSAPFRAYDSFAESFSDYVDFLQSRPRYAEALSRAHDARAYIAALHQAGYATDPDYAAKVLNIMRNEIRDLKVAQTRALIDG